MSRGVDAGAGTRRLSRSSAARPRPPGREWGISRWPSGVAVPGWRRPTTPLCMAVRSPVKHHHDAAEEIDEVEADEENDVRTATNGLEADDANARRNQDDDLDERERRDEHEGREDHDETDGSEENDEGDVGEVDDVDDVDDTRIDNEDRLRDEGPVKSDVHEPIVRLNVYEQSEDGVARSRAGGCDEPLTDASAGGQR